MGNLFAQLRSWAPAFLVAACTVIFAAGDFAQIVERPVADALLRISPNPPPPEGLPDAAVVLLDARSLRAEGGWPWPRARHGELIDRIRAAGARAIGLDISFSSPGEPTDDAALAEALRRSGTTVLAAFRDFDSQPEGQIEVIHRPPPHLASEAAAIASVLIPLDSDGVVRRARSHADLAGDRMDSLPAALLNIVLGESVQASELPADFQIDYRRRVPELTQLRASDVLAGRFDPALLRDQVVFVGASAAELQDLWSTPVDPLMPGVQIHALAYRSLAAHSAGQRILRQAQPFENAGFVLMASFLAALASRMRGQRRWIGALGAAVGTAGFVIWMLGWHGIQLDLIVPLLAVAGQYALGVESLRGWLAGVAARSERSLVALEGVAQTTSSRPGERSLDAALGLLSDVVDAEGVALLRTSEEGHLDGRRLEWRRNSDAPVGEPGRAAAVLDGGQLRVFDATDRSHGTSVYVPLIAGDAAMGVLVVACAPGAPPDAGQLRTIATAANQMALSAENLRLLEGLRDTFDAAIAAIATAVEERDGYTELHCRRLAALSVRVGERLALPAEEIEGIRLGALLHDVGKIGIRDNILLKPGRFTDEERLEMQRHPDIGHRIIAPIPGLGPTTAACVRHHHERWDGRGYPLGLSGLDIPLGARIVSVVDVWDALSTARPYKDAWPAEKVLGLLRKGRGADFDPDIVDLFLKILDEEGLDDLLSAEEIQSVDS